VSEVVMEIIEVPQESVTPPPPPVQQVAPAPANIFGNVNRRRSAMRMFM
jgi:hypothetical protein